MRRAAIERLMPAVYQRTAGPGGVLGAGKGSGMSIQKLPSGRWRAQVYDASTGKLLSVSKVLGRPGTFRTKTEAKQARDPYNRHAVRSA